MSRGTQNPSTKKLFLIISAAIGLLLLVCCGGGAWFVNSVYHRIAGVAELPPGTKYSQWRDSFESDLTRKAAAPQDFEQETPPANVREVSYESDNLHLKAWVYRPPQAESRSPALLFLHGGFAFGMSDLLACQAAMDEGFVVMAPALRGENGNPGNFEMLLGEVNDARAAAQWLAKQDYVDANRIYAFGHSIGGGISAMLPLLDDVPIQHSGSSGGLYPPTVFLGWAEEVPFKNNPEERMARLLIGNIKHMQRPHFAYIGQSDSLHDAVEMARSESTSDSLLKIDLVPGDHFTSFDEALKRYLDQTK